jgi:outer membrane protein
MMQNMVRRFGMCVLAVGLLLPACGRAAEQSGDAADDEKASIYVGAGALVSTKPYIGTDAKVYPIPLFGFEGENLYLRGTQGGYRLIKGEGWSIGPVLQPRFDGYEQDDSSALDGMDDRDLSLDAGIGFSWLTDYGLLGATVVTDVLGKHDGQEVEFSYTALFQWLGFDFIPSAGLRWKSTNLVEYYFGVRADEARAGRPAYAPGDTIDPFVRLAVRRELDEKWSLLSAFQYEWLADEIADSPIVDDDYDISIIAGVLYTW